MSKKVINEEKIIYTCDFCKKEASENYDFKGDYCNEHGRTVSSMFDDLARIDKEKSEELVEGFLKEQQDTYETRVLEFLKKVPKAKAIREEEE